MVKRAACGITQAALWEEARVVRTWALVLEKARRSRPAALGSCSLVCWQMTSQPGPLQGPQRISTGPVSTSPVSDLGAGLLAAEVV